MRHLLLWMARNRLLKRWLPRIWFVRRAVRRFMPGETVEEALDAAEFFRPYKIGILFTQLGAKGTRALVDKYVKPAPVAAPMPDALKAAVK